VYVKDFVWDGRQPRNVPLGAGQVDPTFFSLVTKTDPEIPVSLHIEYLDDAGLNANVKALGVDLTKLKKLLGKN